MNEKEAQTKYEAINAIKGLRKEIERSQAEYVFVKKYQIEAVLKYLDHEMEKDG